MDTENAMVHKISKSTCFKTVKETFTIPGGLRSRSPISTLALLLYRCSLASYSGRARSFSLAPMRSSGMPSSPYSSRLEVSVRMLLSNMFMVFGSSSSSAASGPSISRISLRPSRSSCILCRSWISMWLSFSPSGLICSAACER